MIILKYDPYVGNTMPEGRVSQYVKETLEEYHNDDNNINNQYTITFGQSLILQYFRIAVKEGRLDSGDIIITMKDGVHIPINHDGSISYWPDGFCDYQLKTAARLISRRNRDDE